MKDVKKYLINSILAGILIGIGGTVFLSLDNKVIGSMLFSIGLLFIVSRKFNLYTGKVGYIPYNNKKYLLEVFITIIGNFIGTFFIGTMLRFTRIYGVINTKANNLCTIKLNDSMISILILSFFCGILMFLAVDGYKTIKDSLGKNLSVIICVMVFILCGFEHSIANMYYFSVAATWSWKVLLYLLIMVIGNGIGGILIPLCYRLKKENI